MTASARNFGISQRLNEYFNTSVFSQPAPFTLGNVGRTLPDVRAPGTQKIVPDDGGTGVVDETRTCR
jgi:hypothetical protein